MTASFLAVRPNYSFHVVVDGRRRGRRRHPGRHALGHLDQRRLLRAPPRDLRPPAARGGSGRGAVPPADRRRSAAGAAPRWLLGADGHAQGQAVARGACTRAATRRGSSGTGPTAPVGRAGQRPPADAAGVCSRRPDGGADPRARDRRPCRRHRDRLRRHDPEADRARAAIAEVCWVVLSGEGDAGRRGARRAPSALLERCRRQRGDRSSDFRDGFFPYDGARDQGVLRGAQGATSRRT